MQLQTTASEEVFPWSLSQIQERTSWWTRSYSISPPGTRSRSTLIAKREERGSSEQNKGQLSSLKKSLDFMNDIQAGGGYSLFSSWCNSSCFWPLTWTIPIQSTPQMRQHLFSCIQNQAIAMKKYRRAPRLLVSTDTYPVYCIFRMLEMSTSENWAECSTCKEWYHCIKVPACCFS